MKRIFLLLLCLALQACAMPRPLPLATDLNVSDAEVVVIGKIELVPAINPRFEQKTHWNVIGEERLLTRLLMATGAEHRPVDSSKLDGSDFQNCLEVEWGVPFAVKAPRQRTFLNGGLTHLNVVEQEQLWFPGGYYFDVPVGATAVYIGTLRFYRNDFNTIVWIEVVDEPQDIAAVLKAGGAVSQVRPSLLQSVTAQ